MSSSNTHQAAINPNISWAYQNLDRRDLRLDFMRGLIMIYLVVVHMEFFSLFSLLAWERLGLVSSAEGFVLLSGIVVGLVYAKRAKDEGLIPAAKRLWRRAFKLYRVNVFVILSIALLGLIPFINVHDLTHWWIPGDRPNAHYLYPAETAPWWEWLWKAFTLQIGPHQYQVIGLYVVLMGLAPLVIFLLLRGQWFWILLVSWIVYISNLFLMIRLTPTKFELGFPLLTWQLLFFNGLVIGFYREQILSWLIADSNRWVGWLAGFICLGSVFLAFNNPYAMFWPWESLSFIAPDTFQNIYGFWFNKTMLGPGRLLNNAALFVTMYILLSRYWLGFNRVLGWFLIPLGQASLYVFTVHIYIILLVINLPIQIHDNIVWGTTIHGGSLLLIWLMVKHKVLFNWIPR
jgi:hypothetical protein